MRISLPVGSAVARRAFTVIELMLSVAIMTVIFIALYTVFDVTQKALRSTMSQVDVLEGIRATTDLMARDLEGAVPLRRSETNVSLAVRVPLVSVLPVPASPPTESVALEGLRAGGEPVLRTTLQELFLINRQNDRWTAIGYWFGPVSTNLTDQPITVGRLYRFSYETNSTAFGGTNLYARFNSARRLETSQPVMDGVVHFRIRAYDVSGEPLVVSVTNRPPVGASWFDDPARPTETMYEFWSGSKPAFPVSLELEIGVLEPQMVTRFASIPLAAEARKFLARNSGKVHLLRQRIRLRNAPPY